MACPQPVSEVRIKKDKNQFMCLYTDIHAELYTHAQDVDACGRSVQQPWCRGELNTPSAPLRHSWPQGCQSQLCPGALGVCCHLPVVIHFNVGVILGTSEKQQMKKNVLSCSAPLYKAANLHLRYKKKRLGDQHSAGMVS